MKTRREEMFAVRKFIRPVAWGLLAGMAVCLVILLLMAAIMTAKDIPQGAVTPMALVAAASGALTGGFTAACIAHENGWLLGAVCGLLLYVLIALTGFIFLQGIRGEQALLKLLILVACGAVGGIIGVNRRKRR